MVDTTVLATEILSMGHGVRIPTIGTSMHPHIRFKEIIHVQPASMGDLNIGDIAVYAFGCRMVAHRVLKKGRDGNGPFLITKGDSMRFRDEIVRPEQVRGKVIAVERGARLLDVSTPRMRALGRFYAWISPFSILTYPFLWRIERAVRIIKNLGRTARERKIGPAGRNDHPQPIKASLDSDLQQSD